MRMLWRLSAINVDGVGAEAQPSRSLRMYRGFCIVWNLGYWIAMCIQLYAVGKWHLASFMLLVALTVALPCQVICWSMHDNHGFHLLIMLTILKTHSSRLYKHINKLFLLVFAAMGGAMLYIPPMYAIQDRPTMGLSEYHDMTDIALYICFGFTDLISWVPAGFSVVISTCLIMLGHYSECEAHRWGSLHNYREYIGSGDALYDLQVIYLRIVQTSSCWTKVVFWGLTSSSIAFFAMFLSYLSEEGIMWSVYPPLAIMLPSLWSTGLAGGAVTSRFTRIYISICTRSPLLLEKAEGEDDDSATVETRNKRLTHDIVSLDIQTKLSQSGRGSSNNLLKTGGLFVKPGIDKIGEGSEDAGDDIEEANPNISWIKTEEFARYRQAHLDIMELCKHFEDIFGIRLFGLKISAAQIVQIATFYGTGATLILQNNGKM